jgi:hypothetical protein
MTPGFPPNDNEGSPKPRCSTPTHQSTAKLIPTSSGFWFLPGGVPRASAAEAQREPARQRCDSLTSAAKHLLYDLHPLFFLKGYLFF